MRPVSRFCEMNRAASASGAQAPVIGRQVVYGAANRATGTAIARMPTMVTMAMPGCGDDKRVGSRVAHTLASCGASRMTTARTKNASNRPTRNARTGIPALCRGSRVAQEGRPAKTAKAASETVRIPTGCRGRVVLGDRAPLLDVCAAGPDGFAEKTPELSTPTG